MTNSLYETFSLPNGLRIIYGNHPSDIAYCGFAVNAGTRDELSGEYGVAHFIEHMLFKGTTKRKAHHIASRMENVGGDLNAYTTKEETFIYATFLNEYTERAMELLGDIVFNSTFPQSQIDKEREVILDEINSYEDAPSELIYDDFEKLLFTNHELGHYILGDSKSLEKLDTTTLKNFFERQYIPSKMIFFYFGKTPFDKILKFVHRYFDIKQEIKLFSKNRQTPLLSPVAKRIKMDKQTSQAHCMIGNAMFGFNHPDKYNAVLLNHLLGGANMSSRLNLSLREKSGLVYSVESAINFYSDCGVFNIYFACDAEDLMKCERLVIKEIDRLKTEMLTASQLNVLKRKLKGELAISYENKENTILGVAKSFLHHENLISYEEILKQIDCITPEEIRSTAKNIWMENAFLTLIYH